jgi:ankyrin repeat protein
MGIQEDFIEAVADGDLELAQLALEEGATPDGRNIEGETALTRVMIARPAEGMACVRWLLSKGAHVAAEQPLDGNTSVHLAAKQGDIECLILLLAADGKWALEKFDDMNRTPLMTAAADGDVEMVNFLADAGANIDAHLDRAGGDSALITAVKDKDDRMVECLLRAGADPHLRGEWNRSAVHWASEWADSKRHPELRRIYQLVSQAVSDPLKRPRRFRSGRD